MGRLGSVQQVYQIRLHSLVVQFVWKPPLLEYRIPKPQQNLMKHIKYFDFAFSS